MLPDEKKMSKVKEFLKFVRKNFCFSSDFFFLTFKKLELKSLTNRIFWFSYSVWKIVKASFHCSSRMKFWRNFDQEFLRDKHVLNTSKKTSKSYVGLTYLLTETRKLLVKTWVPMDECVSLAQFYLQQRRKKIRKTLVSRLVGLVHLVRG